MLKLVVSEIRDVLKELDSVVEIDLYFYLMEIIKVSTTKNITIDMMDFQSVTYRKSKGLTHFVTALDSLNNKMCLFQTYKRLGNQIQITHTNYTYFEYAEGFTLYDCNEIYSLNRINEKKVFIYMKSLQYKGEFNLKLNYLSNINVHNNVYQVKKMLETFNIISNVTKTSDTQLNIKFNEIQRKAVEKPVYTNKYNKTDFIHKFDPKPAPEVETPVKSCVDLPSDAIIIQDEIKNILGNIYTENLLRFGDTMFYKKNESIFVVCQGFMIQWYKDNRFDKRIPNMFNRLNPEVLHNIVFIENNDIVQSND